MADVNCNHGVLFVVGVCLLVLIQINGTRAITCLKCENVENVKTCARFIQCADDEVCYMESQLSTKTYQPVYTSGCRSTRECFLMNCTRNTFGSMNGTNTRREDPGQTICSQCCYNDTCNTDLCGVHYIENKDSNVHCFRCIELGDNETCSHTTECQTNEMCIAQINPRAHDGRGYKYELGCFDKRRCLMLELVPKEYRDSLCCNDDLCNTNPKSSKHVSPAAADSLVCPSDLVKTPTTTIHAPTSPISESTSSIATPSTARTTAQTSMLPTTTTPKVTSPPTTTPTVTSTTTTTPKVTSPTTATPKVTSTPTTTPKVTSTPTTTPKVTSTKTTTHKVTSTTTTTPKVTSTPTTTHKVTSPPTTTPKVTSTTTTTPSPTTIMPLSTRMTTKDAASTGSTSTTSQPSTRLTTEFVCRDYIDCSDFIISAACDTTLPTQHNWAYTNCRKTCEMCNDPAPCVDEMSNCAMFGNQLCTNDMYRDYKPKCKAFCKLC